MLLDVAPLHPRHVHRDPGRRDVEQQVSGIGTVTSLHNVVI
ncbi:hypothetical protein, partial [Pseudomonas aeruginosa]